MKSELGNRISIAWRYVQVIFGIPFTQIWISSKEINSFVTYMNEPQILGQQDKSLATFLP